MKPGSWRAVLQSPGGELPFGLELNHKSDSSYAVYAINGEERLPLDDAVVNGDSIRISMDIFDAVITAHIADEKLNGQYTKYDPDTITQMPFQAEHGEDYRFNKNPKQAKSVYAISGKWTVTFSAEGEQYPAVGVFKQDGNEVTGTFLTTTGDYRYLAGSLSNDSLFLSCFDGNHAFLFKARVGNNGKQMDGDFWSGSSGYEQWSAVKDDKASLPDANSLTFLKEGYDKLSFSFPDPAGKIVSLDDPAYKGKVVIVQLLGTWCPNCMDETNFLAPWYKQNKGRGVEVIGLAYEKSPELAISGPKIDRMKKRLGVAYKVLLAGTNDKEEATKTLPMLNQVLAFPTTIFIDKKGNVHRIHTGFSGPGTGKYYQEFVEEFNAFVDQLIKE